MTIASRALCIGGDTGGTGDNLVGVGNDLRGIEPEMLQGGSATPTLGKQKQKPDLNRAIPALYPSCALILLLLDITSLAEYNQDL